MKNQPKVKLIALWDFSGPEGAKGGESRGMVRKGSIFFAEEPRVSFLIRAGKARPFVEPIEPRQVEGPTRNQAEAPEALKVDDLNMFEFLDVVRSGAMRPEDALRLENDKGKPRKGVVEALEKMMEVDG